MWGPGALDGGDLDVRAARGAPTYATKGRYSASSAVMPAVPNLEDEVGPCSQVRLCPESSDQELMT